jgi:hypothetical protein
MTPLLAILTAAVLAATSPSAARAAEQIAEPPAGVTAADATVGQVWRTVRAREAELGELIAAEKLGEVGPRTRVIRDLVATMPAKSPDLPPEKAKKLEGWGRYVKQLTERIDTAAKAKDVTDAQAALGYLTKVLGAIEGLYPTGALG